MFEFLKTLFSRILPALEKQGQPPAVNRQGVAAVTSAPQQAIFDNKLADNLQPAPAKNLMTQVEPKSEVKMADWKEQEKSGTAQNLDTPKWMAKETPTPELEVAATGSADIERSGKPLELSVDETTTVTSPTPKPKTLRKANSKTTGSADVERSSMASELILDESTAVSSRAAKPKSLRTPARKTAAVKKTVKAVSKKAGGVSETKKKTAGPKAAAAKPTT